MANLKYLLIFICLLLASACAKKENNLATIQVQFDQKIMGKVPVSSKLVESANSDGMPDWGLPDPTSLAEVNCYGIFIHGNEPELRDSFCRLGDDHIVSFGPRAGFYALDEKGQIDVLAGSSRTIYLVGMSSADGTCQKDLDRDTDLEESRHSNPFIIGRVTSDLNKGENVIEIPLKNDFTDSNRIVDCNFFDEEEDDDTSDGDHAELLLTETIPYDYGIINSGQVQSKAFTLTNVGLHPASAMGSSFSSSSFSYTGGNYPGAQGDCGATLAPGASCSLEIDFSPVSGGSHSDSAILNYFDGLNSQSVTIDLQGTAHAPALLAISEASAYDYGDVPQGNVENHTFNITNNGGQPAILMGISGLSAPFDFAGGSYPGSGGDCGSTLNASDSCSIEIEFSPMATGTQTDTIELQYNDGVTTQTVTRDLTGNGVTPAILTISGVDTQNIGSAATTASVPYTFTITNVGQYEASSMAVINLMSPFTESGGTCVSSLSAGASCTIVIEFTSPGSGSYNETLEVHYYDGQISQQSDRLIEGTGL